MDPTQDTGLREIAESDDDLEIAGITRKQLKRDEHSDGMYKASTSVGF